MPQPALDPVADHGATDRLGDDEADHRPVLGRRVAPPVQDHAGATDPAPAADRPGEVGAGAHPHRLRQHEVSPRSVSRRLVRPTGVRGPCGGGRPGRHARRGSASGDGSHGCGCGADGSAGRCACSRVYSETCSLTGTDARVHKGADVSSAAAPSFGSRHATVTGPRYAAVASGSNRGDRLRLSRRHADGHPRFSAFPCSMNLLVARFTLAGCLHRHRSRPPGLDPPPPGMDRRPSCALNHAQAVDRGVEQLECAGPARPERPQAAVGGRPEPITVPRHPQSMTTREAVAEIE